MEPSDQREREDNDVGGEARLSHKLDEAMVGEDTGEGRWREQGRSRVSVVGFVSERDTMTEVSGI